MELAGIKPHEPDSVVRNLAEFRNALGAAKLQGIHLEVSQEIFTFLVNSKAEGVVDYESVRIYVEGMKKGLDKIEKMSVDQRSRMAADKWREENPDKL